MNTKYTVSQSLMFIYKAHLKTTAVGQSAVQCINQIYCLG